MQCCLLMTRTHYLRLPRLYRLFAMEVILATAFGRAVNIQRGESDDLILILFILTLATAPRKSSYLRNIII